MFRKSLCAGFSFCPAAAPFYGPSITTTKRLWDRIAAVNKRESKPNTDHYLRLQITSGGCLGYQYEFLFEPKEKFDNEMDVVFREGDERFYNSTGGSENSEQVASSSGDGGACPPVLIVDTITLKKLSNAVIDYHSEIKGSAFVVVGNELVDGSCACGQSVSMKAKAKKSA